MVKRFYVICKNIRLENWLSAYIEPFCILEYEGMAAYTDLMHNRFPMSQLAFWLNLYRTVIGAIGILPGR